MRETLEERKAESEKRLEQIREHGLEALEDPDFRMWFARTLTRISALHDDIPLRASRKSSRRP